MAQDPNQVTANPDEIRARIEQTRSDMTQTLARIQSRLRPRHLAAEAKRSAKQATVHRVRGAAKRVGETASGIVSRPAETGARLASVVRRHPIPAALAGLMTTWWIVRAMYRRPRVATVARRSDLQLAEGHVRARFAGSHATDPSWRR